MDCESFGISNCYQKVCKTSPFCTQEGLKLLQTHSQIIEMGFKSFAVSHCYQNLCGMSNLCSHLGLEFMRTHSEFIGMGWNWDLRKMSEHSLLGHAKNAKTLPSGTCKNDKTLLIGTCEKC